MEFYNTNMEKYFTVEAANRALALVSPIVRDIMTKMREAQSFRETVKQDKASPSASEVTLLEKLNKAEKLLNQVEYHMKELESVGVLLKDLQRGLVDFPCLYDGRIVYLCWMFGEEHINFWHETDRGFTDRRIVDASFMKEKATA